MTPTAMDHIDTGVRTAAKAEPAVKENVLPAGIIVVTHAYFLSRTRNEKKLMKPYVPLDPLYAASALRGNGYAVRFHDTTFENDASGFARALDESRPPLAGIYVMDTTRAAALGMIRMCNARAIPVVVWGPDPSLDPEFYILKGARYVIKGAADETMPELTAALLAGKNGRSVAGVYSDEGLYRERPAGRRDDDAPFPARDLADLRPYRDAWERRHGFTSMQISLGRERTARGLAEEMLFVKMVYRPDQIVLCDGMLGRDRAWICDLRDEVERKRAKIPFECTARADLVDTGMLKVLKESGCFRVWYEASSGSPRVLERMRKGFTVSDIRRAAALTREAGIQVGFMLILGYPGEAVADVEMTRALIRTVRPDRCSVEVAYPQRGTEFYREVEADILPARHGARLEHDNILTYRARYSQDFYDAALKLIQKESSLYARPPAGIAGRMGTLLYRLGYGLMKTGVQ